MRPLKLYDPYPFSILCLLSLPHATAHTFLSLNSRAFADSYPSSTDPPRLTPLLTSEPGIFSPLLPVPETCCNSFGVYFGYPGLPSHSLTGIPSSAALSRCWASLLKSLEAITASFATPTTPPQHAQTK